MPVPCGLIMRLFEAETINENLDIAKENLSDLANEILWLLDFAVDDPPARLGTLELGECRKLLRLIVEDLPPVIVAATHAQPESKPRCEGIFGVLTELRQRHPSSDPSVWSATFSTVATLRTYVADVAGYFPAAPRPLESELPTSPELPDPAREEQPERLAGLLEEPRSTLSLRNANRPDPLFRQEGDFYRIRFEDVETSLKAMKGLAYLSILLSRPHQPVFCGELESVVRGETLEWSELRESPLDEQAIREYRGRLSAATRELDRLPQAHSSDQRGRLIREIEWLEQELSRATDRNGQPKKMNPSWEKSRKRVGNAIARALDHMHIQLPALAAHVRQNLDSGFLLVYRPNSAIEWQI